MREIFRQLVPHADGKLAVSASTIEYVDAKRKMTIATADVRQIGLANSGGVAPYIVVSYQDGKDLKRVGFQPLNHPEETRMIAFSIETATRSFKDAPGETLGDPALQRDTARTIMQAEKAAASD